MLKIKPCTVPLKPLRTCTQYVLDNLFGKYGAYFQHELERNSHMYCPKFLEDLQTFKEIFPEPLFRRIYPGKWSQIALREKAQNNNM